MTGPQDHRLVQVAITASLLGAFLVVYVVASAAATQPLCTRTVLDDPWPLLPGAVWLYLSPYPLGVVVVSSLPRPLFWAFCGRGVVVGLLHAAAFFLVPTVVARPIIDDAIRGPSAALLRFIYQIDLPTNAAPSAHVSVTVLITWTVWQSHPRLRLPAVAWCLGVCATVVLTGQHHVFDAITGAGLIAAVLVAADRWQQRRSPTTKQAPS
jgi:hypothetical protein